MSHNKHVQHANELVARWKTVIDESNPAGLIELDDLDNFLGGATFNPNPGGGGYTAGCSTSNSACCTCNGASSCC